MCEVNREYKKIIANEKGKQVLYMQILKALYGGIYIALSWYELFSATLLYFGFKLNPYECCIANKMINENQCNIIWSVDDNKVSHMYDSVNSMIVDKIEDNFGKLLRTKLKKHIFLGMNIEFMEVRKLH